MNLELTNPIVVANALREYQLWRRGEGKYEWSEDPNDRKECPFNPTELGKIEDAAIMLLINMHNTIKSMTSEV